MRAILILLLGFKLTDAVTHSYGYIYTETTGIAGFPEFVSVGMVDGQQVSYFDTHSMKMVPRTDWVIGAVDPDFWNRNGQNLIAVHQSFKINIEVAKQRFNQTDGVHTVQEMYGCEWDDETGETDGFRQEGYDGEDFLSVDLKEMRWVSPVQQGFPTVQKWNNDRGFIENDRNYFTTVCTEWLKKYLQYGKSSLQKTVSPQVSLLQKNPSSPVKCHATGFYPSGVTISWQRNGHDHHEDVDLSELLPNEDGTFQKSSTLKVTADEWKNNKFSCVVEHQGRTVTEDKIRTNNAGTSVAIFIIGAVAAAVILLVVIGVGFMVHRIKKGCFSHFKPVKASDDSSSEKSTNSLISSGSGSGTSNNT